MNNYFYIKYDNNIKSNLMFYVKNLLIGLTIFYCVIFPADKINVKEIFLGLTIIVCLQDIVNAFYKSSYTIIFVYSFIYFGITTLLSITLGNSSVNAALSFGYVWEFLLLIPTIIKYNININKIFIYATMIVACIIDFIFLSDVFNIISIYNNPVVMFFSNMNELQWGKGELATFGYSIFYKSSPLIIFSFGLMLFKKKYIYASIYFLSLLASGTRANLLISLFILVIILFVSERNLLNRFGICLLLICIAILFLPDLIERLNTLNALKYSRSEEVKLKAIYSIFEHMNEVPRRYIFGSGIGSYFYSSGRNAYVDVVEVSFFDYFRQVGLLSFIAFIYFLIRPIRRMYKNKRWMLICYIGYLAIAFTNPLLVTSTSFMVYVLVWSNVMNNEKLNISINKDID